MGILVMKKCGSLGGILYAKNILNITHVSYDEVRTKRIHKHNRTILRGHV